MHESAGDRGRPTTSTAEADELDLALVNALQLQPRASWSLLGQTLGISPVTAARRWSRLSAAGIAWVTAYGLPSPADQGCVAFLDLDCAPDQLWRIADALADEPHVLTIDHFAQGCDLHATAAFTDLATVSRYTTERLGRVPGINSVRVHLATGFYAEGIRYRLDSLEPTQRQELHGNHPAGYAQPSQVREEDRELLIQLGIDGRLGHAELAAATGLSPSTVRRRLDRIAAPPAHSRTPGLAAHREADGPHPGRGRTRNPRCPHGHLARPRPTSLTAAPATPLVRVVGGCRTPDRGGMAVERSERGREVKREARSSGFHGRVVGRCRP